MVSINSLEAGSWKRHGEYSVSDVGEIEIESFLLVADSGAAYHLPNFRNHFIYDSLKRAAILNII